MEKNKRTGTACGLTPLSQNAHLRGTRADITTGLLTHFTFLLDKPTHTLVEFLHCRVSVLVKS